LPPSRAANITQAFKANSSGRDFIVGDIHGHFDLLEKLMARIKFNIRTDRLFATGDLIDRGPFSEHAIQWLAHPWFHSVRGNHEQMAIDSLAGEGDPARHARNGGAWFYSCSSQTQTSIVDAVTNLPFAIEICAPDGSKYGIIHAESPGWENNFDWADATALLESSNKEFRDNAVAQALYARKRICSMDQRQVEGLRTLYVGHTTVPEPLKLGNVVYIDTGCSFPDGKLTIIEIGSEHQHFVTDGRHDGTAEAYPL
jgi:serine/threonine protein phosphatase 1